MWLAVGFTAALVGIAPRGVIATLIAFAGCFVAGLLGEILDFPHWVRNLSPSSTSRSYRPPI